MRREKKWDSLIQATVQINLLITKIRKIIKESGWQLDQEFNFEHVKFDMPVRHSCDNCSHDLQFREKNEVSSVCLVYMCTSMVLKAMGRNDIIQRMSECKEEKRI